jgi:hypothetical protein
LAWSTVNSSRFAAFTGASCFGAAGAVSVGKEQQARREEKCQSFHERSFGRESSNFATHTDGFAFV